MRPNNITTGIALALVPFTIATTENQTTHPITNAITEDQSLSNLTPKTTTLTLTAYEFPFCLASDADYLQNFFISRPTHTNLTLTLPPSFSSPNGECVAIEASKGIPHSFFYTVYEDDVNNNNNNDDDKDSRRVERRDFGSCELLTFEKEGCEGKSASYSLMVEGETGGHGGRSKCFSRPDRFVKALLRSARIYCEGWAGRRAA